MTEFKVGDKVQHATGGMCVVRFGPYRTRWNADVHLLEMGDGTFFGASDTEITALPTFTAGDRAKMHGETEPVEIVAGPFTNKLRQWYAVRAEMGDTTAGTDDLTALPAEEPIKVGDRVRVTDDDGGGVNRFNGRVGTIKRLDPTGLLPYHVEFGDGRGFHGATNGRWNCRAVELVTDADMHTINGITYDLTARYRDCDGDVWVLKDVDGTVRASIRRAVTGGSQTLTYVVENYGPLRKV